MKTATIRSSWVAKDGHRLDCSPYLSGALEAKVLLETLPLPKHFVGDLVSPQHEGIYFAGRESVQWVESPEFGIPFLRGKDIQLADLSKSPLISKRQVERNPVFLIHKGMTLITRSGTIGKTAYVRGEMEGMATSDPLRVVPDRKKIPPGYLYAYLTSKFGVPLFAAGAYGAIIQHLESSDIASIPVPRIGDALEREIHKFVEQASDLRTEASKIIEDATTHVSELLGIQKHEWRAKHETSFACGEARISSVFHRLDPFHYIGYIGEGIAVLGNRYVTLGTIAHCFRPNIFKRIKVSQGGIPFVGGAELQTVHQEAEERIALITKDIQQYVVREGMVLFQCVGQRYGILGRPYIVTSSLAGKAVTEHVMRVVPHEPASAGYLVAYFRTEVGRRCLLAYSAGTSIPVLQDVSARHVHVFWPDKHVREKISEMVVKGSEMRAEAWRVEQTAIRKTEEALRLSN